MGAQKMDAYKMTGAQKTRENEPMGPQTIDACKMTDAEKNREYELNGAQKTGAYEMTSAQNVRVDNQKHHAHKPRKCNIHADKTDHRVGVWRSDGFEIKDIARVRMLT